MAAADDVASLLGKYLEVRKTHLGCSYCSNIFASASRVSAQKHRYVCIQLRRYGTSRFVVRVSPEQILAGGCSRACR